MAFTLEERQLLGIHGLIPPRFKTQEEQLELCRLNVERYLEDLNKYIYLMGLQVCVRSVQITAVSVLMHS
jgi:malate dehydrogenase (oxaloacetate-decarboxylating)(NADP+)